MACSGASNNAHSPMCTCPAVRRKAPIAVISEDEIRPPPLSRTTCLPLPLPPTPIASRRELNNYYYREPDYLRMERTLISSFDGKPFMPKEPERVYYARSNPKCVGELYSAHFEHVLRLKKNQVHRAEYVIPTDPMNTPFHSVVYLKGERKAESIPMLKETAQTAKQQMSQDDPPIPYYAIPVTPQGTSLLEPTSGGWDAVLRALASTGASRSSKSSHSGEADEMVKMWKAIVEKEGDNKLSGRSGGFSTTSGSYAGLPDPFEGFTTPSGSFSSIRSTKYSAGRMIKPLKKINKESSVCSASCNDITSSGEPLTERGAFRSGSSASLVSVHSSKSTSHYTSMSQFTEWQEEIKRLRDFLEAEKSTSSPKCYTAKTISSVSVGGPSTSSIAPQSSNNSVTFASKFAKVANNGRKKIAAWARKAILQKS